MLRTELSKLLVHCFEADGVELGFEAKMAKSAFKLEHFEFDVGQHRREKVIGLRGHRFK